MATVGIAFISAIDKPLYNRFIPPSFINELNIMSTGSLGRTILFLLTVSIGKQTAVATAPDANPHMTLATVLDVSIFESK
jgi:hypothetical protein